MMQRSYVHGPTVGINEFFIPVTGLVYGVKMVTI